MPTLLRKVQEHRWYGALSAPDDPLPADPVADLATIANALSVWQVLPDESNLDDVVVAIAASFQYVSKIDVVLVDEQRIGELGLEVEENTGRTPLADSRHYHRDLVQLSANALVHIGEVLRSHGTFKRFSEKQVGDLLAASVNAGRVRAADLQPKVRDHLAGRHLL